MKMKFMFLVVYSFMVVFVAMRHTDLSGLTVGVFPRSLIDKNAVDVSNVNTIRLWMVL